MKGKWELVKEFEVKKVVKVVVFGGDVWLFVVVSVDYNLCIFV